jgi:hypothetical protein
MGLLIHPLNPPKEFYPLNPNPSDKSEQAFPGGIRGEYIGVLGDDCIRIMQLMSPVMISRINGKITGLPELLIVGGC